LRAVKKGQANNRGISLAGTIVSWLFTAFGALAIVGAIAIPIFLQQQEKAHEAAVTSDLRNLNLEVANYYVDYMRLPEFSFDGQNYHVASTVIGADTTVTGAQLFARDAYSYCIQVQYGNGLVRSVDDLGNLGHGC
jgi:type II secretory pathway pseudopilin PulG